ncbi:hypothetical protein CDL15_Pgr011877 [Punica granatum]|uniref:Pentatricopeptide repeat-containing protein n=1 Tax=Punica granatum TaxID=22663 RepID=A0A218XDA9_PUNGR|nr:hypothetical protein CDL15_Pgr011877 [Punica granatum]
MELDEVSWNSMILGYGNHARAEEALKLFSEMEKKGPMPNGCGSGGKGRVRLRGLEIEEGPERELLLLRMMSSRDMSKPEDIFCRSEEHQNAKEERKSTEGRMRRENLRSSEAKRLIELDPTDIEPYVPLSNIYAEEGNIYDDEGERLAERYRGKCYSCGVPRFQILVENVSFGGERMAFFM